MIYLQNVILFFTVGFVLGVCFNIFLRPHSKYEFENNGTRSLHIVILWFLWSLFSLMIPEWLFQPNYLLTIDHWQVRVFSICLIICGAIHLAVKGIHPWAAFFYGGSGTLLVMPHFLGQFEAGLWFQTQSTAWIALQWIGFTLLLGGVSSSISLSVSIRRNQKHDQHKTADALCQNPEGMPLNGIAEVTGLSHRRTRKTIKTLVAMKLVIPCKIPERSGDQELDGYRWAYQAESDQ